jgi:uncharacterized protein (DUF2235 family)
MANKPKVPLSDSCDFYLLGFGTHTSGCGQINVTDRPPQFGVFFDGTGNNLANAAQSIDSAPTNIAKLYLLYLQKPEWHVSAKYIVGVGTKAGQADSDIDMAIAYTIGDKVKQAITDAAKFFETYKNAPIGILDVFGFSRGAAAARHFVNEVHRLNKQDPKHFGGPQLKVRFLGLFDTVGSIGIPGDNSQKLYDGEEFILDINPNAVLYAYQLTARHEQRKYFPLSSIYTAAGQAPAPHFEEVELPGAHSDVGGGYGSMPQTVYYPIPEPVVSINHTDCDEKINALKRDYEQRYHAPGINIKMQIINEQHQGPHYYSSLDPQWKRPVNPQLAFDALHKMHTKAKEKGVPLEELEVLTQKKEFDNRRPQDVYVIPSDLKDHLTRLETEPHNTRIEDYVYQHYIHHSHQYRAKPKPWAVVTLNSNAPQTNPKHPASNGKREVFYNETAKGYSPADQWKRIQVNRGLGRWVRQ